jgi:3-isopropylmalate/(R)-2-methylmalate dehydratase small subunit
MEPFVTHRGRLALLDWTDVNTDLIIPARYLKKVERIGFGPLLFADKRYVAGAAPEADNAETHGRESPDFPLNNPAFQGATVLLVGKNFGCGSSREHAVWAIMQAGYRAVIAPGKGVGFADIFESNAFQNGLLPIELPEGDWQKLAEVARPQPESGSVVIDLTNQTITFVRPAESTQTPGESKLTFDIPESHRHRLLRGLDAIAETLTHTAAISEHEQRQPAWLTPQVS